MSPGTNIFFGSMMMPDMIHDLLVKVQYNWHSEFILGWRVYIEFEVKKLDI